MGMRAYRTTAFSIPGSFTTFIMDTEDYDTLDAYNIATGIFTCPLAGRYSINFQIAAQAVAVGQNIQAYLRRNTVIMGRGVAYAVTASAVVYNQINDSMTCAVGDQIDVQVGGSPLTGNVAAGATRIVIDFLGA